MLKLKKASRFCHFITAEDVKNELYGVWGSAHISKFDGFCWNISTGEDMNGLNILKKN